MYTNKCNIDIQADVLETYFTDRRAVWASFHGDRTTNYFIMIYIVFKVREQQKKAVNRYEKSFPFFQRNL